MQKHVACSMRSRVSCLIYMYMVCLFRNHYAPTNRSARVIRAEKTTVMLFENWYRICVIIILSSCHCKTRSRRCIWYNINNITRKDVAQMNEWPHSLLCVFSQRSWMKEVIWMIIYSTNTMNHTRFIHNSNAVWLHFQKGIMWSLCRVLVKHSS